MKPVIAIYCCGGVKKDAEEKEKLVWSEVERNEIMKALAPVKVVFLSPLERADDISQTFSVFGRDHYQISQSDFVVADLRQRRGIGVGIEMLSAKFFGKPVITVAPPNSHYRRAKLTYLGGTVNDYVHAHLYGVSDAIVDNFKEAALWIKNFLQNPKPIKGMSIRHVYNREGSCGV